MKKLSLLLIIFLAATTLNGCNFREKKVVDSEVDVMDQEVSELMEAESEVEEEIVELESRDF